MRGGDRTIRVGSFLSVRCLYSFPFEALKSTFLRTASRRLTCPINICDQTGHWESILATTPKSRSTLKIGHISFNIAVQRIDNLVLLKLQSGKPSSCPQDR